MKSKQTFLLALSFFLVQFVTSQSIKDLNLSNKISILNDRIFFNFPDSAAINARSVSIMSHDPNAERETRIIFDRGDQRMVFFAQEIFKLGDGNTYETIKNNQSEKYNYDFSLIDNESGLTAIQSTPTKWDNSLGAILINQLIVLTKDSSMIRIDVYINPAAYNADKENYIQLSKEVFKTLKNGKRLNELDARKEKHEIFGTKKAFVFDLPANTLIQIDQKYDFQVFRLIFFSTLGDTSWQSISIYTGNHPSFFYPDYDFEEYTEKQKSDFLNKTVEWLYFANEEQEVYLKEQKIESDNIQEGLIVHIAMTGSSPEIIQQLTKIVEAIQLKE